MLPTRGGRALPNAARCPGTGSSATSAWRCERCWCSREAKHKLQRPPQIVRQTVRLANPRQQ
eukprot:7670608-Lingulodinium_polyedra.AAC.1